MKGVGTFWKEEEEKEKEKEHDIELIPGLKSCFNFHNVFMCYETTRINGTTILWVKKWYTLYIWDNGSDSY